MNPMPLPRRAQVDAARRLPGADRRIVAAPARAVHVGELTLDSTGLRQRIRCMSGSSSISRPNPFGGRLTTLS
jgi:hypothetical protein